MRTIFWVFFALNSYFLIDNVEMGIYDLWTFLSGLTAVFCLALAIYGNFDWGE
jgi:hypothetical protein